MKRFTSQPGGKTIVLRLERGDLLRESITEAMLAEGVRDAVVVSGIAALDEAHLRMATNCGFPVEYENFDLREPLELGSLAGTLICGELHLHGVIGSPAHTWAGHLLDGCRVSYLAEVVLQEIRGGGLARKPDANGMMLITDREEEEP